MGDRWASVLLLPCTRNIFFEFLCLTSIALTCGYWYGLGVKLLLLLAFCISFAIPLR